ncbi:sensor histidine kinase [Flexithrix dorotheae]|uniref:sensor histidine kinase n=1 Tax=Flexithrix dorotheae TaxID=70993 RepID=UPI0003786B6F|nr:two-component regulator propeller domain-containing protein [Flexithrix dorotheae]
MKDFFTNKPGRFKINFLLYFIFIFLYSGSALFAQPEKEVFIKRVTLQDGSIFGSIYCIWQDPDGFIWVGTEEGAYRYNGYGFDHLIKEPGKENSLLSNLVKDITGKDQKVYIATFDGLSVYDLVFNKYTNYPSEKYFENENLRCLRLSSSGDLYIGTTTKLFKLADGKIIPLSIPEHVGFINTIFEDNEKNMWIGGESGCAIYYPKVSEFKAIPFSSNRTSTINLFFEDDNGSLWAGGTSSPLQFIDKENWKILTYEEKTGSKLPFDGEDLVESCSEDFFGNLWLATESQPLYFNKKALVEGKIKEQCCLEGLFLSENFVIESYRVIITDRDGRIWLGSFSTGLYVIDFNEKKASHYYYKPYKPNHLSHNNTTSFAESPKGKIWIGTDGGGLNCFDKNSRVFQTFQKDKSDPGSISGNIPLTIVYDSVKSGIWVGHWDDGLDFLDLKTQKFTNYPLQLTNGEKFNNSIFYLQFDNKHRLWAAIPNQGLFLVKPEKGELIKYDHNDEIKQVEYFFEDSNQQWWVCSIDGLYIFNLNSMIFTKKYDSDHGLGSNYVNVVAEDSYGRIWAGTQENGLNLLDIEADTFITFSAFNQINIVGIVEDEQNFLWISAHEGLFRIKVNMKNEIVHYKRFSISDGLQSNHFKRRTFLKSSVSNELFFGGVNGFNIFVPATISEKSKPPSVFITNLFIHNKPVSPGDPNSILEKDISKSKELTLGRHQNNITFECLSLNFTNSQNNLYQVKLENFDEDWVNLGHSRKVTYTNLNPGNYTFRFKGSNHEGVWSEQEASIEIKVLPLWWETLSAKIAYVIGAILSIWFLVRIRLRMLKLRNKILEKKVEDRTKEISEKSKEILAQNEELEAQQGYLGKQNIELENTIKLLKSTQSQLVQSEKLASLGFLTAGIAHEINNPINFIKSGIVGLEKSLHKLLFLMKEYDSINDENVKERLAKIKALKAQYKYEKLIQLVKKVAGDIGIGANRTADIVKELRTFARIEGDGLKLADIHEGINSSLILLANQYQDRIKITRNYGEIPKIECFPGKLNQVFMNLLVNAIQAIEGKGEIIISTCVREEEINISITDSGHGMDPEIQKHIFEPFFSTKEEGQGTGLGLSISLSIIKEHQGKIEVESELGKGSTINLRFPLNVNLQEKAKKSVV